MKKDLPYIPILFPISEALWLLLDLAGPNFWKSTHCTDFMWSTGSGAGAFVAGGAWLRCGRFAWMSGCQTHFRSLFASSIRRGELNDGGVPVFQHQTKSYSATNASRFATRFL